MNRLSLVIILMFVIIVAGCSSTTVINTEPQGAKVIIDGEVRGVTPYTHTDSKPLWYTLSVILQKDGYEAFEKRIDRNDELNVPQLFCGWCLFGVPALYSGRYKPQYLVSLKAKGGELGNEKIPGNIIYMYDGSEIIGEIVSQTKTSVTVKTKYATMTIEKSRIKEIKYK